MNLNTTAGLITVLLLSSTACSVYKSAGRGSFESKASQNHVVVSAMNTDETCWNQPAADPLWHLEDSTSMSVTKINEDEIQVCATPI